MMAKKEKTSFTTLNLQKVFPYNISACTTKGDIIGVESPADYSNILDANSSKCFLPKECFI